MLKAPCWLFRAPKQTGFVFIFCQSSKINFSEKASQISIPVNGVNASTDKDLRYEL